MPAVPEEFLYTPWLQHNRLTKYMSKQDMYCWYAQENIVLFSFSFQIRSPRSGFWVNMHPFRPLVPIDWN